MKESNVRASMRELCLPDSPAVPRTGCRERVQVVVRCRPLSEKEIADGHQNCVIVDAERYTVEIHGSGRRGSQDMAPKVFTFDRTYGGSCSQKQLYNEVARPIVHSVMLGYNGTVLAYGQTASGKTFTMEGLDSPPDMKGIIPNAFEDIFAYINQSQSSDHFLVRASYLEIYNEEIRDLLAPRTSATMKLELKETGDAGIFVKNLTSLSVYSLSDISRLLTVGKKNRSVGATLMNQDSSRSHSIFTITVEAGVQANKSSDQSLHVRVGKLNLVDLAGSERMCKTGATGDRFKELTNINWSLSALGNVISALVDGKSAHIPYRDSKLTRLLQDSLGGNTRTVMVANIGPADYNLEESISTLRYANRAKNIRNKPCINEDPKDTLLREFQAEIFRLKEQLKASNLSIEGFSKEASTNENEKVLTVATSQTSKESIHYHTEREDSICQPLSEQAIAYIKADLERKAHLEIEYLKAEKERSEEEKDKIAQKLLGQLKEMQIHYEALTKEKEDREVLTSKLKALEEKLLHGSNTNNERLKEKARQQEQELALYEQELQKKQQLDEERQKKIAELEEAQLMAEEKSNSMEEELELKTSKLRNLKARYQQSKNEVTSLRAELQDTIHEFHQERADLLLHLRSLDQQHQLKSFIIETFIPSEEVSKIMQRIFWDEETDSWSLQGYLSQSPCTSGTSLFIIDALSKQPLKRPGSAVGRSRPTCQKALESFAKGDLDPRYLEENILKLELDIPKQSLFDYNNHSERAQAQACMAHAFVDCKDDQPYLSYEIDVPSSRPKSSHTKSHILRPRTATK